jgi:hypothetical protein
MSHEDCLIGGSASDQALWKSVCKEVDDLNKKWVDKLRQEGFKAAHPNDGWVDRENNKFELAYPHFDDGIEVGDKVMLGWEGSIMPGYERPVIVVEIEQSWVGTHYKFTDAS